MLPVDQIPADFCRSLRTIFTDIDDTLTVDGILPASAYSALCRAVDAGISVVPVTGRPAGWCDHIARMWPVSAVVGENGAVAFALDQQAAGRPQMRRLMAEKPDGAEEKLSKVRDHILAAVPGCKVAADQPFRIFDLAIDISEEVTPLAMDEIARIATIFAEHGATAKISSVHVNGWFGKFDKLTMCQRCSAELLRRPLDSALDTFSGDSPNDAPMFGFFEHGVGVANVLDFTVVMAHLPRYITPSRGGFGFAEFIDIVLKKRALPGKNNNE